MNLLGSIKAQGGWASAPEFSAAEPTALHSYGNRRFIIAVVTLALSALTSVVGYWRLEFPVEYAVLPRWADLALMSALIGLPVYLTLSVAVAGPAKAIARFAGRSDSEHEQSIIRIAIVAIILIYLFVLVSGTPAESNLPLAIVVVAGGFVIAWLLLIDIWSRPKKSVIRRIVGNHADLLLLSLLMHVSPKVMAPCYLVYLWTTFGNGFRFGVPYLFVSATLSVIGFGAAVATTPFWQEQLPLAIGLLIALGALPGYVSPLLLRLRHAIDEAEMANQAKSRFLASMSHELRTPLSAIIGTGDLLRETPLDAEQHDMARTIRTAARSLLSQVNEILDFSKIEAGRLEIVDQPFDLYETVASVDSIMRPQALAKEIRFALVMAPTVCPDVMGDGEHLQEVLINLAANAVKFTERGEVALRVSVSEGGREQQKLRFELTDSGIGMTAEQMEGIFESFTQADNSITRRYGGTGLGLAITKRLVEHMGGEIHVESEPGRGSRFWFELPMCAAEPEADERTKALTFEAEGQVFVFGPDAERLKPVVAALQRWDIGVSVTGSADDLIARLVRGIERGARRAIVIADTGSENVLKALREVRGETGEREPIFIHLSPAGEEGATGLPAPLMALPLPIDEIMLHRALRAAQTIVGPSGELGIRRDGTDGNTGGLTSLRILLVEDNAVNRKVITKILTRAGHRPFVVDDGDSALDALDTQEFDLVLMDVNLPGMSGPEATKNYRFAHMGEPHLPIIALTADATLETRDNCLAAGMDGVVTKPIEARGLIDMVETVVGQFGVRPPAGDDIDTVLAELRRNIQTPRHAVPAAPANEGREARAEGRPSLRVVTDPPLDIKAIDSLRALGDEVFVASVVDDFLTDTASIIQSMRQAVATGHLNRIREQAHALRSSAAHVGAARTHIVAKQLYNLTPAEIDARGASLVDALEAELAVVREALLAELKNSSSAGATKP